MASSTGTAMKLFVIQESYKRCFSQIWRNQNLGKHCILVWKENWREKESERDFGGASEKVSGWSPEF